MMAKLLPISSYLAQSFYEYQLHMTANIQE
jgi:hypothetical protein